MVPPILAVLSCVTAGAVFPDSLDTVRGTIVVVTGAVSTWRLGAPAARGAAFACLRIGLVPGGGVVVVADADDPAGVDDEWTADRLIASAEIG